ALDGCARAQPVPVVDGDLDHPGLREPGSSRALPRFAAAAAGTSLDARIRSQRADPPRHDLRFHAGRAASVQGGVGPFELLVDPSDGVLAELCTELDRDGLSLAPVTHVGAA